MEELRKIDRGYAKIYIDNIVASLESQDFGLGEIKRKYYEKLRNERSY